MFAMPRVPGEWLSCVLRVFHQVFGRLSAQLKRAQWQVNPAFAVRLRRSANANAQSIVKSVSAFIAGTPDVQAAAGEFLCDVLSFGDDQQQQ